MSCLLWGKKSVLLHPLHFYLRLIVCIRHYSILCQTVLFMDYLLSTTPVPKAFIWLLSSVGGTIRDNQPQSLHMVHFFSFMCTKRKEKWLCHIVYRVERKRVLSSMSLEVKIVALCEKYCICHFSCLGPKY